MCRPLYFLLPVILLLFPFISCKNSGGLKGTGTSKNNVIVKKYATVLDVPDGAVSNTALYLFIDGWIGTPYKYGGKDKNGIDCSGFTSRLVKEIYGKEITGPSWSIAENAIAISANELKEGDFVFFQIESKRISHIGVYLQNRKFVHASVSKGVIISSLDEKYYQKYFHSCGRPK